jgi:hypothetical protein
MGASREVSGMLFEFVRLRGSQIHEVLALAVASSLLGSAGCSSTNNSATAPHTDAAPICPNTPQDTIGKACAVEGTVCGPQYTCGNTVGSLYCVCTGGAFQCRDGAGNALSAVPACPNPPGQQPPCPASLSTANLQACTRPGQICAYPSACPSAFDQCTCFPGETASGGFGIVFVCEQAVCASDAAAPPPPVDAGPDTAPEASPPDASSDDASLDAAASD